MIARRDVAAPDAVKTKRGDEIRETVDDENACDSGAVIEKADEGTGDEHAALHADENGGVGAGELARRNHFLHESVDGGPVHRGAGASDQRHRVEVPELKIS